MSLFGCVQQATVPRVAYLPAGITESAVWFVEERGTENRRQYLVMCHRDRMPPCARVQPATVRGVESVREWMASESQARGHEAEPRVFSPPPIVAPLVAPPALGEGTGDEGAGPVVPVDVTAANATGTVRMITPGGWANVYNENGQFLGQTPIQLELDQGTHELSFRPFGQPTGQPLTVDVLPGRTAVVVRQLENQQ